MTEWAAGACQFAQVPFKRLFQQLSRPVASGSDIVTAYTNGDVTLRSNRRMDGYHEAADLSGYQGVLPGDFVVHGLDILRGSVGVSDSAGAMSSVCTVCQPRRDIEPRYMAYAMRAQAFTGYPRAMARGIREGGADFRRWETLGDLRVPNPPVAAQRTIAAYLDAETARIDGLVSVRERQLESIGERRSIATDRIMAEHSLGSDWPLVRLKYVVRGFVDTLHATAPDEEDGPGYIVGTGSIKGGTLDLSSARRCSPETLERWTSRATPRPGDVLLTREAPAGEAALVPDDVPLAAGQRVVLIQTDPTRMLPRLIVRAIYSRRAAEFFDLLGRETTVAHLNMSDIGAIPVVVPPMSVQHNVADAIENEVRMLDELAARMKRQVELLLERRQALITAAVTGQVEIPGVAA